MIKIDYFYWCRYVIFELMKELCNKHKGLPKAGLNGFDWAFVQGSTFVLRLNFCAKNPRLRQAPNR